MPRLARVAVVSSALCGLLGLLGPVAANALTWWAQGGTFGLEGPLAILLGMGVWLVGALWAAAWAALGLLLGSISALSTDPGTRWVLAANGLLLALAGGYGVLAVLVFG